jgi:hypothetical protein
MAKQSSQAIPVRFLPILLCRLNWRSYLRNRGTTPFGHAPSPNEHSQIRPAHQSKAAMRSVVAGSGFCSHPRGEHKWLTPPSLSMTQNNN